ncbi:hypothetical protein [Legionella fairfieldensis]|uniref:hypothetical protein n=1 Tax=Legionella fairfieldensis TaxID=45064 RepID=UPI00048F409D|nr:hypothetical protein [Legionella fairfieldensis]
MEGHKLGLRFFQQMVLSVEEISFTRLVLGLIDEIRFFKSAFEDELERALSDDDKKKLQTTIEEHTSRLKTLEKIKNSAPISSDDLDLLLQYGNNKKHPELVNYPNVLNFSKNQTP